MSNHVIQEVINQEKLRKVLKRWRPEQLIEEIIRLHVDHAIERRQLRAALADDISDKAEVLAAMHEKLEANRGTESALVAEMEAVIVKAMEK